MRKAKNLQLTLTCDDAPTLRPGEHGLPADPSRMDRVREILVEHGIPHCVAFVIGSVAEGQEERLAAWLDTGYELGNHTFDHLAASETEAAAFLDSVRRCDVLLRSVGAFDDSRKRYFRFPYLDRGSPSVRADLHSALRDMGYTCVPASVDLFDHEFEAPLQEAQRSGNRKLEQRIEARHLDVATRSIEHARRVLLQNGIDNVLIPYFHFGAVSTRTLPGLLEALERRSAEWIELDVALVDPAYQRYEAEFGHTGLFTTAIVSRSVAARLRRRLVRAARGFGWFDQHRLGPMWPHLG